jgi:hypothetical protein
MEPSRYRKKPVVIEAMRLIPGTDNWKDVCDWMHRSDPRPDFGHYGDGAVRITTLEGTMYADSGDWIIRGVQGEFYPCKPDIFEATYEALPTP